MPNPDIAILNPNNPLSIGDALMVAVCGMVIVFMMLATVALVIVMMVIYLSILRKYEEK